jgi:hypothetical protein
VTTTGTTPNRVLTREDIEAKFRELNGEVGDEVEASKSQAITVAAAVVVVVIAIAFLAGRRRGRRRSAVIEVVRV